MAAANCAAPGPLELHLHDAAQSAAGQAIARGKPLQASLHDGPSAEAAAAAWSDVVQMLGAGVPGIAHLLCLPFGSSAERSCGSAAATGGSCGRGRHQRSGDGSAGALLCGFAAAPSLDTRCKVALAALLRHLPAAMAGLSGDTLEFIDYVCGTSGANCCCDSGPDSDAGAEGCRPDGLRPSGAGNGSGSGPLRVAPDDEAAGECSSPAAKPSVAAWARPGLPLIGSSSSRVPPGTAALEAAQTSYGLPVATAAPLARQHGFSKCLLAHVAAEPGALRRRSALFLRFSSDRVEGQYQAWLAPAQQWTDTLGSVLIVAAMLIVALRKVS